MDLDEQTFVAMKRAKFNAKVEHEIRIMSIVAKLSDVP